jgi:predicted PurR-regulated permease PerM
MSVEDKGYISRAVDVFIRMSLLAIMGASCFVLLRPFLNVIIAGVIIAIAIYPGYRVLTKFVRGRQTWAAVLCTLLLLLMVIVPSVLLAGTLAEGIRTIAQQLQAGQIHIPPPPPSLAKLPVIGTRIDEFWSLSSTNLSEAVKRFRPEIQKFVPTLLAASAGITGVILQFLISVLLAGFLLANSAANARFADRVFARVFGDQGTEFKELVGATIRGVTNGILGVALIQTLCASLGFWLVGLPGAGLWAVVFLIAAVLQVGVLVLVPAVLYAFATYSTTHASIFLVWCIFVALMDNLLKPILLGRGSKVPMLVIFLGVLGGFMVMRIIGLFVGAIVLSVGYKLAMAWIDAGIPSVVETHAPVRKAS